MISHWLGGGALAGTVGIVAVSLEPVSIVAGVLVSAAVVTAFPEPVSAVAGAAAPGGGGGGATPGGGTSQVHQIVPDPSRQATYN